MFLGIQHRVFQPNKLYIVQERPFGSSFDVSWSDQSYMVFGFIRSDHFFRMMYGWNT